MDKHEAYRKLRTLTSDDDPEIINTVIETIPNEVARYAFGLYRRSGAHIEPELAGELLKQQPREQQTQLVFELLTSDVREGRIAATLKRLDGAFLPFRPRRSDHFDHKTVDYAGMDEPLLRAVLPLVTDGALHDIVGSDTITKLVSYNAVDSIEDRLTHDMIVDQFSTIGQYLTPKDNTLQVGTARKGLSALAEQLQWSPERFNDEVEALVGEAESKDLAESAKGKLILLTNHPDVNARQFDAPSSLSINTGVMADLHYDNNTLSETASSSMDYELKERILRYFKRNDRLDDHKTMMTAMNIAGQLHDEQLISTLIDDHDLTDGELAECMRGLINRAASNILPEPDAYFFVRSTGAPLQQSGESFLKIAIEKGKACAGGDMLYNIIIPDLASDDDKLTVEQREEAYRELLQLDGRRIRPALKQATVGPPPSLLQDIEPEHEHFDLFAPFMSNRQEQAGRMQRQSKTQITD